MRGKVHVVVIGYIVDSSFFSFFFLQIFI